MAEAMISGLLSRQVMPPGNIWASGPRPERAEELRQRHGIQGTTDNLEAVANADLVILAVQPLALGPVLRQLKGALRPGHLVVSIIGGARLRRIAEALGHPAVVRCMPNLPCRIHRGMTVWTAPPEVSEEARETVRRILRPMGQEVYVPEEMDVDRATAINGSGPAIVASFVKALEDAATFIGESRSRARQSVLQTLLGTAEMILSSERHVAELIDGVTSPAGTTSRALHCLHQGRFSAILTDAIDAAFRRSLELGDLLDEQLQALQDEDPAGPPQEGAQNDGHR
jgi:pyrroline-5-carboxylate reductase